VSALRLHKARFRSDDLLTAVHTRKHRETHGSVRYAGRKLDTKDQRLGGGSERLQNRSYLPLLRSGERVKIKGRVPGPRHIGICVNGH
jgi:hypothetical protein